MESESANKVGTKNGAQTIDRLQKYWEQQAMGFRRNGKRGEVGNFRGQDKRILDRVVRIDRVRIHKRRRLPNTVEWYVLYACIKLSCKTKYNFFKKLRITVYELR